MANVGTYLNFPRNTEEAFNFYKSVFGGEFLVIQRFKDTPEAGKIPLEDQSKLMHIALPIGKGNILMGTDATESSGRVTQGTSIHLSVNTESDSETKNIFTALSAGGKVTIPLDKMFWGAYFGMCTDKFGLQWMVSNDKK